MHVIPFPIGPKVRTVLILVAVVGLPLLPEPKHRGARLREMGCRGQNRVKAAHHGLRSRHFPELGGHSAGNCQPYTPCHVGHPGPACWTTLPPVTRPYLDGAQSQAEPHAFGALSIDTERVFLWKEACCIKEEGAWWPPVVGYALTCKWLRSWSRQSISTPLLCSGLTVQSRSAHCVSCT